MKTYRHRSLTVKASALAVAFAMAFSGTGLAQEPIEPAESSAPQVLDEKAAKAKAEVMRHGVGEKSKVRVKMRDKHQLTGRIILVDEYSFQLQVEPSFLDDLEPAKGTVLRIPYAEVDKVRCGRSRAATVAISVGAVAAAVAILVAIVVLKVERCQGNFC